MRGFPRSIVPAAKRHVRTTNGNLLAEPVNDAIGPGKASGHQNRQLGGDDNNSIERYM
jgi:hypothetical protein